jgi:hypothetical protein
MAAILIGATERFSAISLRIAFMSNRRPTARNASARTEVMESFGDPLGKPPFWHEIRRSQRLILNAAATN